MLRPTRETKRLRALVGVLAVGAVLVLGACAPTPVSAPSAAVAVPAQQHEVAYPGVDVLSNLTYATTDGQALQADVCLPPDAVSPPSARAAIVVVHGGSWRSGDKANQRMVGICRWLASVGYVAASVNYRLAPTATFPAQIVDVRAALRWLREPVQVARFAIDPARIGALGESAGANLAALLGTEGSGAVDVGTRVAAVVDLSGPVDLTAAGAATSDFQKIQLSFLGCASYAQCPVARAASAVYQVDPTDPPFFIAHSAHEFIPLAQASEFVAALRAQDVATTFVVKPGTKHAAVMLDDPLRAQIVDFFRSTLG
jgi:acetyl esterase